MRLEIVNLHAIISEDGKEILKGVNLTVNTGEMHAIMGPNGTGKSTLAGVIMGNPKYTVTEGDILLDGESILNKSVDERSRAGLFLAMQNPNEIPGVENDIFIKSAMNARLKEGEHLSIYKFAKSLENGLKELKMNPELKGRYVNEGFSGGEKKKNEILQMKMLKPHFAILDEIDSGLDVDALRICGENVNSFASPDFAAIVITHYERLLDYIDITHAHILMNGQIVKDGGKELIKHIDEEGYDWLKLELGIVDEVPQRVSLNSCGARKEK